MPHSVRRGVGGKRSLPLPGRRLAGLQWCALATKPRYHMMMVPGSMIDSLMSLWGSTIAPFSCTSSCNAIPAKRSEGVGKGQHVTDPQRRAVRGWVGWKAGARAKVHLPYTATRRTLTNTSSPITALCSMRHQLPTAVEPRGRAHGGGVLQNRPGSARQ